MLPFRYQLPLAKISRNPDFYLHMANVWHTRLVFIETQDLTPNQNARLMTLTAKASQVYGASQMAICMGAN